MASSAPAASSASGATPTSCDDCAAPRWPPCARRSSLPSRRRWDDSCPPGTDRPPRRPAGGARPAPGACAAGVALGDGGAAAPGARLPARLARRALRRRRARLGSGPGSTGSRSISARMRRCSGAPAARLRPRGRRRGRCATRSAAARCFGPTCSRRRGSRRRLRCRPSGSSSGPVRSRTTPGHLCARPALPGAPVRSAPAPLLAHPRRRITSTQGRWSPTERLFPGVPDRRALAELLLERQGIVTRTASAARGSRAVTAPSTGS